MLSTQQLLAQCIWLDHSDIPCNWDILYNWPPTWVPKWELTCVENLATFVGTGLFENLARMQLKRIIYAWNTHAGFIICINESAPLKKTTPPPKVLEGINQLKQLLANDSVVHMLITTSI